MRDTLLDRMPPPPSPPPACGWESDFPKFRDSAPAVIRGSLVQFLSNSSELQLRAWDESIPLLQVEVGELCADDPGAHEYTAILEYQLPLESRRPDVVLLVRGAVVVLELKGKEKPSQADLDQASAYARDLRCYHRSCADVPVHVIVVPTTASGYRGVRNGVHVAGPDAVDQLVRRFEAESTAAPPSAEDFLADDAYCPLPTLVRAARELFASGELRKIRRASALTDPAVKEITRIIHEAARTRTRRLVLLTGVPGAGKTLVGLQAVHAHFLDDLAIERKAGQPTVPAVFLSGNGPLVSVLQYELREAGGGGKTFVRGVKDYVKKYSTKKNAVPPEHVLVFDEAQRAWDKDMVAGKHDLPVAKSEPEHFIEFSERIPDWCVVVGLVGTGQEIHVGEEAGLVQWRRAIEGCAQPGAWTVHGPQEALESFTGASVAIVETSALNLDTEIRYHLTTDLHRFVAQILDDGNHAADNRAIATALETAGYNLRITRDLEAAKSYLRARYAENADARFGIVASSRDKDLERLGVLNGFHATSQVRVGPWYGDGEASSRSCRHLREVVTEFSAQGLELDAVLLAWGTDFLRRGASWSSAGARRYKTGTNVKSPHQLRLNAYRVLLTRGRDGTVVFLPALPELEETYAHLIANGFSALETTPVLTVP